MATLACGHESGRVNERRASQGEQSEGLARFEAVDPPHCHDEPAATHRVGPPSKSRRAMMRLTYSIIRFQPVGRRLERGKI